MTSFIYSLYTLKSSSHIIHWRFQACNSPNFQCSLHLKQQLHLNLHDATPNWQIGLLRGAVSTIFNRTLCVLKLLNNPQINAITLQSRIGVLFGVISFEDAVLPQVVFEQSSRETRRYGRYGRSRRRRRYGR
jgi:hypothetical protein